MTPVSDHLATIPRSNPAEARDHNSPTGSNRATPSSSAPTTAPAAVPPTSAAPSPSKPPTDGGYHATPAAVIDQLREGGIDCGTFETTGVNIGACAPLGPIIQIVEGISSTAPRSVSSSTPARCAT